MHQHVRTAAGAAALAAALLLTGCSSDGDKGKAPQDSASPEASADAGAATTTPPAGDAGAGDVNGSWMATTNGKSVFLTVQDDAAGILGEHMCTGRVVRQGAVTLDLKCPNGNTDRAKGTVTTGADGKSLTVKWEGSGIEDRFTRGPAGGLPSGIPTDLPSGIPTDLPSGLPSAPELPGS
ncbi:hypothetical protein ACQPZG_15620 [Streptomyces sp. CA-294286]|uniref:hypothetical protein n=1 Tax=Streptomyces sp. CA-294286 TaxID=3240070 RepID=UPI003D907178